MVMTARSLFVALLMLGVLPWTLQAAEDAKKEAGKGGSATSSTTVTEAGARAFSPAELQVLQELEKKRTELDRRQQALELRERLVDLMEKKLADRVEEMNSLRAQLEKLTVSASGKDEAELNQLAQIYGNMKPPAAAVVMNRLDNAIVLDVLKRMPTKKSGKIMEALEPVKARVISEMMAEKAVVLPTGSNEAVESSSTTPAVPEVSGAVPGR